MKKKFLALVLALVMTLTLLPVTALAADTPILYYDGNRVQVGGVVNGNTGTATFSTDSNGGVLTLDNFTGAPTSGGFSAYNGNLKVVLKGTNSLTVQPGQYQGYSAIALTSRGHALTIVGENADTDTLTATVTSHNSAIYSYGGTTIENAGIKASLTGTYDGHMYAIDEMYGDVTIRNSSVIATVENTAYSKDAAAIYANSGSVIIGNSYVEVEATSLYNAMGLKVSRNLTITDSTVKAEASGYCTNAINAGFNACVITDSTVDVTAGGDSGYGFAYMYGPTIGGDSTVTITSVESAERACYGKPTLTDYYIVKAGADAASAQVVADPNADDNEYYLQKYVQIKTSVEALAPPAAKIGSLSTRITADAANKTITLNLEDGKEYLLFLMDGLPAEFNADVQASTDDVNTNAITFDVFSDSLNDQSIAAYNASLSSDDLHVRLYNVQADAPVQRVTKQSLGNDNTFTVTGGAQAMLIEVRYSDAHPYTDPNNDRFYTGTYYITYALHCVCIPADSTTPPPAGDTVVDEVTLTVDWDKVPDAPHDSVVSAPGEEQYFTITCPGLAGYVYGWAVEDSESSIGWSAISSSYPVTNDEKYALFAEVGLQDGYVFANNVTLKLDDGAVAKIIGQDPGGMGIIFELGTLEDIEDAKNPDTPTPPPADDTDKPGDTDKPESEKPVIKPTTTPSYDPTPVVPPANVDIHDDTLYDAAQAVYSAVKNGKADFTPVAGYTKEVVIQMQKDDALKLVVEKKSSYDPAEKALIDKTVEEKDKGALVQFLEIDVTLRTMADVIVAEVDDTIVDLSITVDLNDEMQKAAKDGKTIYVARSHDGKVAFLEGKLNADKTKVTFDSSKFSTYALVAFDSKTVVSPKTADAGIFLAVCMSILSVTGSAVLLKKKED